MWKSCIFKWKWCICVVNIQSVKILLNIITIYKCIIKWLIYVEFIRVFNEVIISFDLSRNNIDDSCKPFLCYDIDYVDEFIFDDDNIFMFNIFLYRISHFDLNDWIVNEHFEGVLCFKLLIFYALNRALESFYIEISADTALV